MKRYLISVDIRYLSGAKDQYDTHISASRLDVAVKRAIRVRTGLGRAYRVDVTAVEVQA